MPSPGVEAYGGGVMKKQTLFLIITGLTVLMIGLLVIKGKRGKREVSPTPTPTASLPLIDEKVEVTLTPRYDKKAVVLRVAKIPEGVTSIDYELSYETGEGLPRGVLGTIRLEEGKKSVEREILLGTCSRNVCVYDTGVKKVNLVLKFNSPQGSSQFQKEYEL